MSVTHEHHASPLHLLPALHLPAAPEERRRQRLAAPCPLPTWLSTFPSVSPTLCVCHSIPAVRVSMLALISGLFWCARWRTVMSPTWTCTWSPGSLWTAL
eukprot:GHVR01122210.1.p1 GENE.GHVR01122210.1~~GHVR01122210.1.p1  ORF type:complete len:100 (-),score=17.26 GHVR01122210.1:301-600(-)